jgi:acyl dehydratase
MSDLPKDLYDVRGPFDPEQVQAASESLGDFGQATRRVAVEGLVPPDVLMGQTLALLAGQPRTPRTETNALASPIEGNVWVREQVTIHRPVAIDEAWTVRGTSARRYVHKGRRYGVTLSKTFSANNQLLVSNCTTGLLSYRADSTLDDSNEGMQESEVHIPIADSSTATFEAEVTAGSRIALDSPVEMTLAFMQTRDGRTPKNPIHSDPEKARRAGLSAPIAGGSHVAACAFELLMREWGPDVLLHGAHIDVRWKSPTYAGDHLQPSALLTSVTSDAITIAITVDPAKLSGTIVIPRKHR